MSTSSNESGWDWEVIGKGLVPPKEQVNHPKHYNTHPSGIECITIAEKLGFNLGNSLKYIWRAGEKNSKVEDLRKALWYVNREREEKSPISGDLLNNLYASEPNKTKASAIEALIDSSYLGPWNSRLDEAVVYIEQLIEEAEHGNP